MEPTTVTEKASAFINVLKSTDTQGRTCVALVLSQNARMETAQHESYPGVALSPEAARQVIAKIQAVLREIDPSVADVMARLGNQ